MENKRYAAIDIGTNTILMVIADVFPDKTFKVIRDEHSIARLGEKVDKTGFIQPEAIERARTILENYRNICLECGVVKIDACGTSALRDAKNSAAVRKILSDTIGSEIEVIPGETEAKFSFIGSIEDDSPSLVIDIGGGSTEIICGKQQDITFRKSLQVGAVRLTERILKEQPPNQDSVNEAKKVINEFLQENIKMLDFNIAYAVAGTATTIASVAQGLEDFEEDKVHGYILTREKINSVLDLFFNSTTEKIITKYHVNPKRADVITAGALILEEITNYLKIDEIKVSAHGLRYGILKNMLNKYQ